MSEWQPIETAPKDGVPIRLFDPELLDADFNPTGSAEGYWQDDEGWRGAVWCDCEDDWHGKVIHPTYWMPLPEPPQ